VTADIWPTIHAERQALLDDLASLTPGQWNAPTACGHWNVHQVFAHLAYLADMTAPKFIVRFAGSGFNFEKYIEKGVAAATAGGPTATLALLGRDKGKTTTPPGPKKTWLGEHFVHGEDIRRALGIKRQYPLDQVARTVAFYARSEPIIHGKSRVAGLTLKAIDTDLSIGSGPVVEGPVMSLLVATSGARAHSTSCPATASRRCANALRDSAQNETAASTSSTMTPSGSVTVAAKPLRAGIFRGVPPRPRLASRSSVSSTGT
jgi:uncharacterized protein (TIGR03083 family)